MIQNTPQNSPGTLLASGILPVTKGNLYKCAKGQRGFITNITFFNTTAGVVICKVYFGNGETTQFHQQGIFAASRLIVQDFNSPMFLTGGDMIDGEAAIAGVNYFIWGVVPKRTWQDENL